MTKKRYPNDDEGDEETQIFASDDLAATTDPHTPPLPTAEAERANQRAQMATVIAPSPLAVPAITPPPAPAPLRGQPTTNPPPRASGLAPPQEPKAPSKPALHTIQRPLPQRAGSEPIITVTKDPRYARGEPVATPPKKLAVPTPQRNRAVPIDDIPEIDEGDGPSITVAEIPEIDEGPGATRSIPQQGRGRPAPETSRGRAEAPRGQIPSVRGKPPTESPWTGPAGSRPPDDAMRTKSPTGPRPELRQSGLESGRDAMRPKSPTGVPSRPPADLDASRLGEPIRTTSQRSVPPLDEEVPTRTKSPTGPRAELRQSGLESGPARAKPPTGVPSSRPGDGEAGRGDIGRGGDGMRTKSPTGPRTDLRPSAPNLRTTPDAMGQGLDLRTMPDHRGSAPDVHAGTPDYRGEPRPSAPDLRTSSPDMRSKSPTGAPSQGTPSLGPGGLSMPPVRPTPATAPTSNSRPLAPVQRVERMPVRLDGPPPPVRSTAALEPTMPTDAELPDITKPGLEAAPDTGDDPAVTMPRMEAFDSLTPKPTVIRAMPRAATPDVTNPLAQAYRTPQPEVTSPASPRYEPPHSAPAMPVAAPYQRPRIDTPSGPAATMTNALRLPKDPPFVTPPPHLEMTGPDSRDYAAAAEMTDPEPPMVAPDPTRIGIVEQLVAPRWLPPSPVPPTQMGPLPQLPPPQLPPPQMPPSGPLDAPGSRPVPQHLQKYTPTSMHAVNADAARKVPDHVRMYTPTSMLTVDPVPDPALRAATEHSGDKLPNPVAAIALDAPVFVPSRDEIKVISMKGEDEAAPKRDAKAPKAQLRSINDVQAGPLGPPPAGFGYLAPPREAVRPNAPKKSRAILWMILATLAIAIAVATTMYLVMG